MRKRILCLITAICFLITGCGFGGNPIQPIKKADAAREEVTLAETIDGDTAWFYVDGQKVKVRFLAIDTEETVHPDKPATALGYEASAYAKKILEAADNIDLEYDSEAEEKDTYGRQLAWVWTDEELLQEKLVEEGLARIAYIYGAYKYLDRLQTAEETAKKAECGIWAEEAETAYE